MPNIKRITAGSLAKSNKVNQLIKKLNALENMTVRQGEGEEQPALNVADNNSELITTPGGGGGEPNGGVPDGVTVNDVLYWNGSEWTILSAPSSTGTWVMGVVEGSIEWIETDTCP
jgi:hypothetical protein